MLRNMSKQIDIPIKKISGEEFVLSMIKHNAWEQLQAYIKKIQDNNDGYCEFAESWKSEFFELETETDINHFMRDFQIKKNNFN